MTFHTTLVLPSKHMGFILRRDRTIISQHFKNFFQVIQLLGLALISFEVFPILSGWLKLFH